MKITRYFQSCILYEGAGVRILIDPSGEELQRFESFGKLDAVLYTHQHSDHFNEELAVKFSNNNVPIFCNKSVGKQLDIPYNLTDELPIFQVAECAVESTEITHSLMPDGSAGPQNTGYFINGEFFHPGDGVKVKGFVSRVAAIPINGPDISMKDAFEMGRNLGTDTLIPIHYDLIGGKPDVYAAFAKNLNQPFHVLPLEPGGTIDL